MDAAVQAGRPSIRVLDATVIDHIAAGEVVERPASVVKELVENAFDAGANAVQVDLDKGGLDAITVTDDGMGMTPDDARLCVLRHATSKLRVSDDLFCIRTLGFRGEALSSIASVSHLTITTRPPDARVGFRLEIRGGEVVSEQEVGCPRGTSVAVRALFYNTPARRKFMRAPATEQAHVVDAALRVGMARRQGGILVMSGARRLLDIPDDAAGHARVVAALGPRVRDLAPVEASQDGVQIAGFVSKPGLDRTENKGLWLFVNGRFVRDRMLQRALAESHPNMAAGRSPTAIVHVDLDPEAVDVNVHPQKLEVRFADATTVFRVLSTALQNAAPCIRAERDAPATQQASDAVLERFASQAWALPKREPAVPTETLDDPVTAVEMSASPQADSTKNAAYASVSRQTAGVSLSPQPSSPGAFQRLTPWGPIAPYWVLADRRGALLLDAQKAAQWLAQEVLRRQVDDGCIAVHQLLFPVRLDVSRALLQRLQGGWESVQSLGFEIEPAGPEAFMLRAVPEALMHAEPHALVDACLRALWKDGAKDDLGSEHALQVLTECTREVQAPNGRAELDLLLANLDAHQVSPHNRDTRAWLRRIDASDMRKVFTSASTAR